MKTIKELLESTGTSLSETNNGLKRMKLVSKAMSAVKNDNLDTVSLHSHRHGADTGLYGTFNVEKTSPTKIHVYDHNTNKTIKIDRKTKRGIGEHSNLMIKESRFKRTESAQNEDFDLDEAVKFEKSGDDYHSIIHNGKNVGSIQNNSMLDGGYSVKIGGNSLKHEISHEKNLKSAKEAAKEHLNTIERS